MNKFFLVLSSGIFIIFVMGNVGAGGIPVSAEAKYKDCIHIHRYNPNKNEICQKEFQKQETKHQEPSARGADICAGQKETDPAKCRRNAEQIENTHHRHQEPAYAEVLRVAQNPESKPLRQGPCFGDDGKGGATLVAPGEDSRGFDSWCKDYADKSGTVWRVVTGNNYQFTTDRIAKIIRLSDNAKVVFDPLGRVASDTTGTKSTPSKQGKPAPATPTQESSPAISGPATSAEEPVQQVDPKDILKKGLGLIKGW